jgi:capsular exopolysaccharide synthesis family protein
MEFQSNDADARRKKMLEVLNEEVGVYDKKIEQARSKVREYAKLAGHDDGLVIGAPGGRGTPAQTVSSRFTHMQNLQDRLVNAEVEVEVAKANVSALADEIERAEKPPDDAEDEQASPRVFVPESQIEARIEKDPAIIALSKTLKKKQDTLRVLGKTSQKYAQLEKEIATVKGDIDAKNAELKPVILQEEARRIALERRDALTVVKKILHDKEQTRELLRRRADAEKGQQTEHSDQSLELQFASDELTKVETIRRQLSDRIVQLQTEGRAPSQVRMIHKATLPEFPDGPTIGKKLAVVGVAAFFAPSMMLVGWSLVRRRIFERQQLEEEFDVKFVSEVAALPSRALIRKPGSERAYKLQLHLFQESINALRTTLATDERLKDTQVFVVVSAVSGEGKSNLSAQLAMSWSHSDQGKVLLIDADLRKPSIHGLFEIRPQPGLAEVLRGECPLEDALVMDWSDRLFVVPAGVAASGAATNLFSGHRFRELLANLRQRFDKIIIDVPPVLCASESLLIAKASDAVLLCALHDFSNSGQVKHAYDRLTNAGVNIVGAVLNGAPVHRYSYTYRGYAPA